ncbi:MAG: tail fiber protein [Victivallaceae bacterium]|nr:tail fiber protein [Victivallaceae bacterium]
MSEPFLGEISIVSFGYAPDGWAFCDGQEMSINQHGALFSILGHVFGGEGSTHFNLPDMRGRVPVGANSYYPLGSRYGVEKAFMTVASLPIHTHRFYGMDVPGTKNGPGADGNNLFANDDDTDFFVSTATNLVVMQKDSVSASGGNTPHNNLQPSIALNFIIALTGIYPT